MLQTVIGNNTPGALEPPNKKKRHTIYSSERCSQNNIVNECPYRPTQAMNETFLLKTTVLEQREKKHDLVAFFN